MNLFRSSLIASLLFGVSQALATPAPHKSTSPLECPKIDRQKMIKEKSKSMSDFLASEAQVMPLRDKNMEILGFLFTNVKTCGFFYSMGLRHGDLLVEVENIPTTSPSGVFEFFQYADKNEPFKMKVLRNKDLTILNVD